MRCCSENLLVISLNAALSMPAEVETASGTAESSPEPGSYNEAGKATTSTDDTGLPEQTPQGHENGENPFSSGFLDEESLTTGEL